MPMFRPAAAPRQGIEPTLLAEYNCAFGFLSFGKFDIIRRGLLRQPRDANNRYEAADTVSSRLQPSWLHQKDRLYWWLAAA